MLRFSFVRAAGDAAYAITSITNTMTIRTVGSIVSTTAPLHSMHPPLPVWTKFGSQVLQKTPPCPVAHNDVLDRSVAFEPTHAPSVKQGNITTDHSCMRQYPGRSGMLGGVVPRLVQEVDSFGQAVHRLPAELLLLEVTFEGMKYPMSQQHCSSLTAPSSSDVACSKGHLVQSVLPCIDLKRPRRHGEQK